MADAKHLDLEFQEGDMVFFKLHPYRHQYAFKRAYKKLANWFHGSFEVEIKVGKVAYKLKLLLESRVHPIFPISLLKRKLGETSNFSVNLPLVNANDKIIIEPEVVLDTR